MDRAQVPPSGVRVRCRPLVSGPGGCCVVQSDDDAVLDHDHGPCHRIPLRDRVWPPSTPLDRQESARYWHGVQSLLIGSTSSRSNGIGSAQLSQIPYEPSSSRCSAESISDRADSAASVSKRLTSRRF